MPEGDLEREQTDAAAKEAAAIGGPVSSDPPSVDEEAPDESRRPLVEAGQGESEGFEESERELQEHASHSDQHAARRAIEDAPTEADDLRAGEGAEADEEHSSEHDENRP